ncbi:hypothetical protein [Burkholderia stagnalis]|uniref:hypothetical protein n=1 Tax=Burkholderia stagnalis TaxID=1503054 RepID=UPI000F5B97CF|nr:hypothetical protein [Burkholderia stagnalis]
MGNSVPAHVLAQLRIIAKPNMESFKSAPWLASKFEDSLWIIRIGEKNFIINWGISLGNGWLTDSRHSTLLVAFKCWLTAQSHPKVTGGRLHEALHTYQRVRRVIALIDYMLLHAEALGLESYGLSVISKNDFQELLFAIESASGMVGALYEWPKRLARWLDSDANLHRGEIAKALRKHRMLREMHTPEAEWEIAKDKRTLRRWRALLWIGGYYQSIGNEDFIHTIDTVRIAGLLYENTLRGALSKPLYAELGLRPTERCLREKVAVPISSSGDRPTSQDVGYMRAALRSLVALDGICADVPARPLLAALEEGISDARSLRETKRFATAPFPVILTNIKNAADFCYRHGEHIISSYAAVLKAAKSEKLSTSVLIQKFGLLPFLDGKTIDFGVRVLSLGEVAKNKSKSGCPQSNIVADYFFGLRGNEGLVELARLVIGSVVHCIGPMTGRRSVELIRIPVRGALDSSRANLIFLNAKTGALGHKQKEERPIPKLSADAVSLCEKLHGELGTLDTGRLLDVPGATCMRPASKTSLYVAMDTFADYFEVACDTQGRRWYVRQHQNRKFLVLAFYYGTAYGNVHTLRWMMGHSDVEHLWHYLTKSVPGDMLREVQAYFMADALQNHPFDESELDIHCDVLAELEECVERRFGTRRFDVIDSELLQEFIDFSIKKGLRVLPQFIELGGRKIARIAVTVRKGAHL